METMTLNSGFVNCAGGRTPGNHTTPRSLHSPSTKDIVNPSIESRYDFYEQKA